ncbi:type IX secretion system membrane protein, PorP/SprF family [Flaviramulus basaltis]|uniref:Type IX secretion system membrane protein, PorP/SprF family n=1 Tax=Flaviramulus basaltis TaxID=369401 RepID=A0A1K2IS29_9FLAO|nr:type IX secretion system membrane protein PorP/SprF [Flaviramulus basaltis]SFZ94992.1 type IX secretion system membrane protein, PorP/SprF family [Flaviramulus basaltis]
MRKIIIYVLFLVLAKSYGQELNLPVFTQYLADNNFVISPTYAGIGDNLKLRANGLTQWVGIKDAPDNQSVYADFRISDRTGIGMSFYNDSNGNTIQTGAKFSFAHHLILDYYTKQYLSFGISYNINNIRFDINNFTNGNNQPPVSNPNITDDRKNSNNNFDVGVLYRNRGFYLSFNANNVLEKKLDEVIVQNEPQLLLNYQIYSGFTFRGPKNSGLEFEPSVYYQMFTSDKRSSTDLNFKFRKFNRNEDYYWAGVSYRFLNDQLLKPLNLGPMAGFKKSIFYFGYAYQVTINDLSGFNSGTHVITIGIDFLQGISNCPCTQSPVH